MSSCGSRSQNSARQRAVSTMKEVGVQLLLLNIVIVDIVVIWILNWLSWAGAVGAR